MTFLLRLSSFQNRVSELYRPHFGNVLQKQEKNQVQRLQDFFFEPLPFSGSTGFKPSPSCPALGKPPLKGTFGGGGSDPPWLGQALCASTLRALPQSKQQGGNSVHPMVARPGSKEGSSYGDPPCKTRSITRSGKHVLFHLKWLPTILSATISQIWRSRAFSCFAESLFGRVRGNVPNLRNCVDLVVGRATTLDGRAAMSLVY